MKKSIRLIGLLVMILTVTILFQQCKKDEVGKLKGTVSLENGTIADGAIVILSSSANGVDVVARAVTDESGAYLIMGLESGTYFLSATWEPYNNNTTIKSTGAVLLTGQETEVSVDGDKTVDIVLSGTVSDGTALFDLDDWAWDNTHSSITFDFPYDGANALFKGQFARAGFDELYFDQANPSNTVIKAWVDVVSIETGSASPPCGHGRDGITGCISNTFMVEKDPADTVMKYCTDGAMVTNWPNEVMEDFDLWGDGSATSYQKQSSIVGASGVATFESTEVSAYGNGYLAKGDFTFAGSTRSVDLYFTYVEGYSTDEKDYVSFYGMFKFAALEDYGISSGHLLDADVTVNISAQFNKAL